MIDRLDPQQNSEHATLERIEKAIEQKIETAEGKPYAVFDFDNTCIANDIGEATLAYLCGHELLRDKRLLGDTDASRGYNARVFHTYHQLLQEGKLRAAYTLCGRIFSGFSVGEAEAAALTAIAEEGSKLGSKILYGIHIERGLAVKPAVLTLMNFLKARQVPAWIVSASADPAVRAAMKHFGIESELIGVRSILNEGVYTSQLAQPVPIMEGKVLCIQKYIDPARAPIFAAGDAVGDTPMLETADIKVVVDRGNELAQIARERGWFLL